MVSIGIYKIENRINHKVYIGQSWDIKRRWSDHIRHSKNIKTDKNNKFKNNYLYTSFSKYGIENFSFEILIELVDDDYTQELLDFYETYFTFYYDSMNKEKGYNLKFPGSHGKHSVISKLKMSNSKKGEKNNNWGKHFSEETKVKLRKAKKYRKTNNKKVINLDNGEIFNSIKEVSIKYNIDSGNIVKCCKNKGYKTVGDFHWGYI